MGVVAILLYSACVVGIGYYFMRKSQANTLEDYFISSRTLGTVANFWNLTGGYFSAWYVMAYPGFLYSMGGNMALEIPGFIFVWAATYYYLGRKVWVVGKAYGFQTLPDLLADRYQSEFIRGLVSVVSIIVMLPYVATSLMAMGRIINLYTGGALSYPVATVFSLLVMLMYTYMSGMRGVAATNVFQGTFLSIVCIALIICFATKVISIPDAFSQLAAVDPAWFAYPGPAGYITYTVRFAYPFGGALAALVMPYYFVKFYAAKNETVIKQTLYLVPIATVFIVTAVYIMVVFGKVLIPGLSYSEGENIIFLLLKGFGMPFLAVLFAVGVIAAVMSTADGVLLCLAQTLARDIFQRLIGKSTEERSLYHVVSKIAVVVCGLVGLAFALYPPAMMFTLIIFAWSIGLQFLPPLAAAFYWPRATSLGALLGILGGVVVVLLSYLSWGIGNTWFGFPGFVVNVLILGVVSLMTEPSPKSIQDRYYGLISRIIYSPKGGSTVV
jgi:SSS family solute:Na+ symporter